MAAKVVKRKLVAATAKLGSKRLSFSLIAGRAPAKAKGFWTDGHLQCSADGSGAPPAYLAEPDFTTKSPTPISTRGWVAWYTAAGGWHWLGIDGEDRGRWNTLTATVDGDRAVPSRRRVRADPVHLGPVSVPAGQGIYAVGVYEIVYWVGGRPDHQWQYVNAGTTGAVGRRRGQPLLRVRMIASACWSPAAPGFIGSHLVDALLERGDHVTVLDDLSTGRLENLAGAIRRGARLHAGGRHGRRGGRRGCSRPRGPDLVFHLAAQIDVRHAVADPARDARINVLGTATVLEQALRHGVGRFVLASTGGAIYGDADEVPTPESEPRPAALTVRARPRPRPSATSSYYAQLHGLSDVHPAAGERLRAAPGSGGEAGVIAHFCAAAAAGERSRSSATAARRATSSTSATSSTRSSRRRSTESAGRCNIAHGARDERARPRAGLGLRARFEPERPGEVRRSCLDPRGRRPAARLATRARRSRRACGARSPARLPQRPELEALDHRHEPVGPGRAQNAAGSSSVLGDEHGLARRDERLQPVALVVLEALLVERPVEVGLELVRPGRGRS